MGPFAYALVVLGFVAGAVTLQIVEPCLWLEIVLLVLAAGVSYSEKPNKDKEPKP